MNGYPQGLLGALGLNEEDLRRQGMTSGLLNAGLQMLAASGPSPVRQSLGQIVAQGGAAGLQGMQQAQESAIDRALRGMQVQDAIRKRDIEERQQRAREEALTGLRTAVSGPGSVSGMPSGGLTQEAYTSLMANPNLTKDDKAALKNIWEATKPRSQDLTPEAALYAQSRYGTANVASLTPEQAQDVLSFTLRPTTEQQISLARLRFETGMGIPGSQGVPQTAPTAPTQPSAAQPQQPRQAQVNPKVGSGLTPQKASELRSRLQEAMPKVTDSAASALFQLKDTADIARKLLQDEDALSALSASGMVGGLITQFQVGRPGTKAFESNALLENLRARNFVSEIQQMRQESPTGGAVGSVAVQEMESFANIPASLKPGMSKQLLKDQLSQLVRRSESAQNKIIQAYERDYTSADALRSALEGRSVVQVPQTQVPAGVTIRRKD